MDYAPHTEAEIQEMLKRVGAERLEDLFRHLPEEILNPEIALPEPMPEWAVLEALRRLAERNKPARKAFLGGGIRSHHVPPVVQALAGRGEFLTAYTPYQPEVSQGVLQATFEYQTMIAELTGLEVANASMYDGATALAEGVLLALRETGRMGVLVSQGVHPEYRAVLKAYLEAVGAELKVLPLEGGRTPSVPVPEGVGAVVGQNPNYLGALEDLAPLAEAAHRAGALFVAVADPLSLGVLKPPGAYGADIAVGDGQSLGLPMGYGGPHFGYLATKKAFVRQLPGRLVSETVDAEGRRGFILTLQAREQYIRRAKAKSNITTNAQLTALMGAMYLAALGPEGLKEVALRGVALAHRLYHLLLEVPGVEAFTPAPFFNEFALRLPKPPEAVRKALAARSLHAATPVPEEYGENLALFAATELHEEEDLLALRDALKEVLA
ncbi:MULTISPECIES: aminomethyl-transferring glycine dehydrogenase subunit GcvPA [Thermus]|jgi:glycine dehydrogenase subunit 1|uniref:Probable glycine dehydrogenase (decarboxylating) subunit 1 n=1 Tax=Thermus brockianus TaxID=56956 RepID=A0A1J0LUV4_THEBO|nr:aminomethyl-transferring glycine dehydrogenase subunit GcvPA [Thermus brockianus]APD09788.1 glycine dehydrogenase subunit 1 [Thermus brockianus]BDG16910.1 putative glycine dehydrogenase (decarboxylating) subunit 1 [Thermus brockianus]